LFQKGSIIVALGAGAPAFFVRNIVEDHLDWVRLGIGCQVSKLKQKNAEKCKVFATYSPTDGKFGASAMSDLVADLPLIVMHTSYIIILPKSVYTKIFREE